MNKEVIDKRKIAILSTVNNFKLYKKSSSLYPPDIQNYVIDGRNGMFGVHSLMYMMKKFRGKDIDWIILMDEDALFIDSGLIYSLIDEMQKNNQIVCGVRDGGMLPERSGNPYVMNPFFSIINLKKLKLIWNRNEILKNHYINTNEFDENISHLKYPYDVNSMSEPYYCFYFWLRRKKEKMLFLDVERPIEGDEITNTVLDLNGNPILYHTWFSREYGDERGRHTDRIDKVFDRFNYQNTHFRNPIIFKDSLFPLRDRYRKFKKNSKKRYRKYKSILGFNDLKL